MDVKDYSSVENDNFDDDGGNNQDERDESCGRDDWPEAYFFSVPGVFVLSVHFLVIERQRRRCYLSFFLFFLLEIFLR